MSTNITEINAAESTSATASGFDPQPDSKQSTMTSTSIRDKLFFIVVLLSLIAFFVIIPMDCK